MDQTSRELLNEKNFAIMDIEYIRTSKTHRCVRKLYMLAKNGFNELDREFYPCIQYKELEKRYQRSFRFCRAHIHKLSYYPQQYCSPCSTVLAKVNQFIVNNDIELILYKGGTIEKDLCKELDIPSLNIECFEELKKAYSHDPCTEVNCYYGQLLHLDYF